MGITDKQRGKKIYGGMDLLSEYDRVLRKATVTLTATQLKALNTTPQVLVAAPAAGKFHVVTHIAARHNFLTTAFAGTNALEFRYTSNSGAKVTADIDAALLLLTASGSRVTPGVTSNFVPVAAAPITVNAATNDPTQGLGSMTFQVFYRTLTA
jgi:hypothetical protein